MWTVATLTVGDMAREPEAIAELRRSLGARLATFRLAAELTQGQLAKIAIYDRTTIVHIEKGRARAGESFWRTADASCAAGGALVAAYLEFEAARAEHEERERERHLTGVRAKAAALRGAPGVPQAGLLQLDGVRRALLGNPPEFGPASSERATRDSAQLESEVIQAHRLYQWADYDGVAELLPASIHAIETSQVSIPGQGKAVAYLAAAKLAAKVGDSGLAWIAADRCLRWASETDRPGLIGIAKYQVACALLGAGHVVDAEQTAAQAVEHIAGQANPVRVNVQEEISAQGALWLLLAIIAARRNDPGAAQNCLRRASCLAARLGVDGNWLWTAFGQTNVAIHELGVRVALGDSAAALRFGEGLDADTLPVVLRGRRTQIHLELAWAAVEQGDDSLAVLHLLEAERVAKQSVSRNATARSLLAALLTRERKSATPGLRPLAARAGILR